jgi:hypothetical protein
MSPHQGAESWVESTRGHLNEVPSYIPPRTLGVGTEVGEDGVGGSVVGDTSSDVVHPAMGVGPSCGMGYGGGLGPIVGKGSGGTPAVTGDTVGGTGGGLGLGLGLGLGVGGSGMSTSRVL